MSRVLLVYGKSDYNGYPYRHPFITLHEVVHDSDGARLAEGQLVTPTILSDLLVGLGRSAPLEFLPERVIVRTADTIVWWMPCVRTMFLSDRGGDAVLKKMNGKAYPQPPMVFKASGSHLWVRALVKNRRPMADTKMYMAPHWNCYDNGVVFFGINLLDVATEQRLISLPHTHLIGSSIEPPGQTIVLPLELRKNVELARTNLVSRMFEAWGEIPVTLLQQMDLRHCLCGYIGLEDFTLYPLIRPGSFVEIDARQNKVKSGTWQNEFERPIYFVELRSAYVCGWCELDGNQLILIPCPQSRGQVRQVRYPTEADIVGRVTAVTMRIAEMEGSRPKEVPPPRDTKSC